MGLVLLLLALQATASTQRAHPLSVRQVLENNQALNGHEIIVSGWMEACRPLDCVLYASRKEARRRSSDYWLSIGGSRWFDVFARRNAPTRVTLRAKFDARCVSDPRSGAIAACADRVRTLDPLEVVE